MDASANVYRGVASVRRRCLVGGTFSLKDDGRAALGCGWGLHEDLKESAEQDRGYFDEALWT